MPEELKGRKEVDPVQHPVVGLVLQVGDAEKFPQTFGFEGLDPFSFRVSKQGPCYAATEKDGGDKRRVELELACKLMVLHHQILLSLAIAANAEAILVQDSVEQVPFFHRVAPRYSKLVTSSDSWPFMLKL